DIPLALTVEHPEILRIGDSHFEVVVLDEENGEPFEGARVCLYKPEEFQITQYTDEDGFAMFDLDPELVMDGAVELTVSGHNLMPYMVDFRVRQAPVFLGAGGFDVDDDGDGESNGDDDGIANPTERIELTIAITNYGEEVPEGEVNITLTPGLPNLDVVQGEVVLENAPAVGESEEVTFVVDIGGGFPDEQLAIFNLECAVGEDTWVSSVSLPLDGPELEFVSIIWEDEPIRPSEIENLSIRIRNIGSKETGDISAELVSLTLTIDVPVFESSFISVQPDEEELSEDFFQLAANLFHLGGSDADLALILTSEAGFVDTVFFSYTVAEAGDGQPFGPDDYGYICLDDTDVEWFSAPEFNWIEIDPHRRGAGDDTDLRDVREEDDKRALFELPFVFTYYGQVFNEITICTNGWLAMGDCSELTTGRNRRFPAGMCAPGMIGPFWDDLLTQNEGGIYTMFDEELNIFIIEWSRMRRLLPDNDDTEETFQVILYDPEFYPTLTGDGDILFQYLDVTDVRECWHWDTPFASVGICSPDQGDGLTYSYWNELADGAAPLEDERAIKFSSSMLITTGRIFGTVTDFETGEPIERATVYTLHGFVAVTDENGAYEIDNAATEIDFDITATADGYNDSMLVDLFLENEGEIEVNFELLHPEFVLSVDVLEDEIGIDEQVDQDFSLTNEGNGQLVWRNEMRNIGDANADPWELREQIMVGEILEDTRIQGAVFFDDTYYIAGSNNRDPQIYVWDANGQLVDQYDQPGADDGTYGFKDLAFDGELIWGSGSDRIFGFTPEGELLVSFQGPYNPNNNIAWDPDNEILWVSSTTSDIVGMNIEGDVLVTLDRQGLRLYGLAYHPFDIDGHNLYLFHKDPNIGDQIISKMNTDNGDTMHVAILEPEGEGLPYGGFITNQFDVFSWVFLAVSNRGSNDRLDIWQIEARRDWAIIEPTEGILEAGESQGFILHIDGSSMPAVLAEGELYFFHNADDGQEIIPININIIDDGINRNMDVELNAGWNIISLNVFPPGEMYAEEDAPGPDVVLMTEQLRVNQERHHIIIMKDQLGRFYSPVFDFNNIPYWNLTEGYQINVDREVDMRWRGEPIPPDWDIQLHEDWNIVAYFPDYRLSANLPDIVVLSSIRDHLLMAKDVVGHFIILEDFEFSNMPPWQPGQGYAVKVDADVTLNYPPPEEELAFIHPSSSLLPEEGKPLMPTSENMSVLITSFENVKVTDGEVVTAINAEGQLVGSGIVQNGMCGLAVWGDDEVTEEIDGLISAEEFKLQFEFSGGEDVTSLNPVSIHKNKSLTYETNSFVALSVTSEGGIPTDYYLSGGYPNPFNSTVHLSFGLPRAAEVKINIYDISGRQVDKLVSGSTKAGNHTVVWDASDISSGIYMCHFEANGVSKSRKLILTK
ncbi:MAG: T9SS type A sorting domain-containing protein, partial [Calditrichaeota bacterium]|nr:T9SS type A sorting domain-containing protein [Calditrichota bacterium]